jgi:hypothetical protein
MGTPNDEPEGDPEPYRLSDEPPPKRRYRPMKGFRGSSERDPDEFDQPALKRFLGTDPFPWALALCVLIWVGLGLGARATLVCAVFLGLAGLAVIVLSQLWLYLSIFMEDREAGFLSLISGWYRVFYLYMNPELAWRPSLLALVGLLMMITGFGLGISHLHRR